MSEASKKARALLGEANLPPLTADLDMFSVEDGIVALVADAESTILISIGTDLIVEGPPDGEPWTDEHSRKRDEQWIKAKSGREMKAARLIARAPSLLAELCEEVERVEKEREICWSCPDCAFTFAAYHTNQDESMTCPVCEVERLGEQRDEAVRIGLSMCRRVHGLVTVAGTGEYAPSNAANQRLTAMMGNAAFDVRDTATLLADSEERARNSERAADSALAEVAMHKARVGEVMQRCAEMEKVVEGADEWARTYRLPFTPDGCTEHRRLSLALAWIVDTFRARKEGK